MGRNMNKTIFAGTIISASLILAPTQSFSMNSDSTPKTPTCKVGYVFSKKKKKCVRKRSEIIPDKDLKKQGWKLAYSGKYTAAISLFDLVANKSDPEALNGLGYSHRKTGKLQDGIAYYKLALSINPNYILAREYLGEGYVAAGRINLAKLQLSQIKQRCGVSCKEYVALAKSIATGNPSDW